MDGEALHSIGELARRTGLTVKTIRSWSDRGIVTPTDRSPAGYRLYGSDAVARVDLVRTLRELGIDLPSIQRVLDQEVSLPDVAAVHAEALVVQIRVLRLRHAVLTVVAERGLSSEETDRMHKLAQLSEAERRSLVDDFLQAVFGGFGADPSFAGVIRTMTPELPDSPDAEQARAWVEWAELSLDADFRAGLRRVAVDHAAERAHIDSTSPHRDFAAIVRDEVAPALAMAVHPASRAAEPVVGALTAHYARILGRPDDVELRRSLLHRLERLNDPRRDRYVRLLAVINGWPVQQGLAPVLDWSVQAVRAQQRDG
ncbi:MerR HTH family regulatory protein [Streptomyces sp. DvalAA-14]|uniref:MerR family transcriptional regulator n=1 Tax=unclassified Streptomyces TaxID=2593676 RepID=UPI00081B27DD|nr:MULTISPECIES: MerR family transcriptional regulator [unclassified Streptomyces]MYS22792.1 MerR family transcriptional regulator [Streptomyces sp. SID4948]SCE22507.1 MerR HTH family regulatory protein [Streptomyces sp. DvalAA-14]